MSEHCDVIIIGTGAFPSSSAVSPAPAAMANAIRVGDHLLDRMGA